MRPAQIREARSQELDAVLDLWGLDGMQPSLGYDRRGLSALLERDPGALLVAVADGHVLGTLIAGWDGWRGCFYRLVVDPEHRRQGLATRLLRKGERRLAELGARRLTAIIDSGDAAAEGFWSSAGYDRQHDRARFVRSLSA